MFLSVKIFKWSYPLSREVSYSSGAPNFLININIAGHRRKLHLKRGSYAVFFSCSELNLTGVSLVVNWLQPRYKRIILKQMTYDLCRLCSTRLEEEMVPSAQHSQCRRMSLKHSSQTASK